MPSLEQAVKEQFAKIFPQDDWKLFKEIAEINFTEAAFLKKASLKVPANRKLLVRNIRKRLLIGIGVELLLKAVYLKSGYGINKPLKNVTGLNFPYKLTEVDKELLDANDTFRLGELIAQMNKVPNFENSETSLEGLKVAKVFRNKEGHVVTDSHKFYPSSYRAIEAALVKVYELAFDEHLKVQFSFEVGEKGEWHLR